MHARRIIIFSMILLFLLITQTSNVLFGKSYVYSCEITYKTIICHHVSNSELSDELISNMFVFKLPIININNILPVGDINGDNFEELIVSNRTALALYDMRNDYVVWVLNISVSPRYLLKIIHNNEPRIALVGENALYIVEPYSGTIEQVTAIKIRKILTHDFNADSSDDLVIMGDGFIGVLDGSTYSFRWRLNITSHDFSLIDLNNDFIGEIVFILENRTIIAIDFNGHIIMRKSIDVSIYRILCIDMHRSNSGIIVLIAHDEGNYERFLVLNEQFNLIGEKRVLIYETFESILAPTDIDCDDFPEIIITSISWPYYYALCFDLDSLRVCWRKHIVALIIDESILLQIPSFLSPTPLIIDIGGNHKPDIILHHIYECGTEKYVHALTVLDSFGNIVWTHNFSITEIPSTILNDTIVITELYFGTFAEDIDHDGDMDILIVIPTLSENKKFLKYEAYVFISDAGNMYRYAEISYEICIPNIIYDSDVDFLNDPLEYALNTSTRDPDTDGDSLPDGWEYMNNLDPLDPQDATLDNDNDGLDNIAEYEYGGDPWDSDTDDDGLSDYDEAQIGTDLRLNDTDGDGYGDGYEVSHGTDPLDPNDYPVALVRRYWWVLMVCMVVIVVFVVFLYRRGVLAKKVEA